MCSRDPCRFALRGPPRGKRRALSGGLPAPAPYPVALRADRAPVHVRASEARARTATQREAARPRRVGEARPEPSRRPRGSALESPRLVERLTAFENAREVVDLRLQHAEELVAPGKVALQLLDPHSRLFMLSLQRSKALLGSVELALARLQEIVECLELAPNAREKCDPLVELENELELRIH